MNHDVAKLMRLIPSFVVFGLWNSSYFNVFAFGSAIVVMQCLISKLKLFREYLNIAQEKQLTAWFLALFISILNIIGLPKSRIVTTRTAAMIIIF